MGDEHRVCCGGCDPKCGVVTIVVLLYIGAFGCLHPALWPFFILWLTTAIIINCQICNEHLLSARKCAYTAYKVLFVVELVLFILYIIGFGASGEQELL